ncbi:MULTISPECIES: leucyl aminopeptidase family protein [unclassified Chelatococcus]|uniref:leucyl aminopeptidase family protein n=1 Tax=unclassified Chelatococcus TaxID=2638111 RepID=UPI001BCA6E8A|nr:leucyl aminopeptidase family protein [Chelatococcus sp.]MBS7741337.1 leucyl aminopeptidase family protein [Chelatococcus sp. HY11]CAH1662050.1 Peptidase B [Hyphomicrobiales bacterium]MBX3546181.1 leucyl aminopeptidase family protein [Chelatococcus sp.]MCO5077170.1 leucyl aminopeptidase family protein [Chelatococcus sp.]CAH1682862.1 Peptidase B [Hyphomicrobiales bacterium]
MHPAIVTSSVADSIPLIVVSSDSLAEVLAALPAPARAFATAQGFAADVGSHLILPNVDGGIATVLFGWSPLKVDTDPFLPGKLPPLLPQGTYRFERLPHEAETNAVLGFLLGTYRFDRYRAKKAPPKARLVLPAGVDGAELTRLAEAVALGRDLINTPANDLGPDGIEAAARGVAERHGAAIAVTVGDDLLSGNFPMIHAVGRASAIPPRLIDLTWGDASHPKVTLVGKGVAFDTGGLDIKPPAGMALMKKDMGGAAAVLALAELVIGARLPVRLRVLIPAVENAISGSAFRPGDILPSRKGLTVEIGNTDAEGRLILGDALALADEEAPDLIVDYATLTGAARVALGPDLPPFYTDDDALAGRLASLSRTVNDPVWRMPFWSPYDAMLSSKIADVNHISGGAFAGSMTAALFLRRFVEKAGSYVHFDIFGWTPSAKPGRPEGGEVQAARLVYAYLKERFGA